MSLILRICHNVVYVFDSITFIFMFNDGLVLKKNTKLKVLVRFNDFEVNITQHNLEMERPLSFIRNGHPLSFI